MDSVEVARIRNSAAFRELVSKRTSFGWTLAVVMFALYMGFIFLVAFAHDTVAAQLGDGPLTVAFPLGLGVIAAAIILTGVYVVRANSEFDRLTADIVGQARLSPAASRRVSEGV